MQSILLDSMLLSSKLDDVSAFLEEIIEYDFAEKTNHNFIFSLLLNSKSLHSFISVLEELDAPYKDSLYSTICESGTIYGENNTLLAELITFLFSQQENNPAKEDLLNAIKYIADNYDLADNFSINNYNIKKSIINDLSLANFKNPFSNSEIENIKLLKFNNILNITDSIYMAHLLSDFNFNPYSRESIIEKLNAKDISIEDFYNCRLSLAITSNTENDVQSILSNIKAPAFDLKNFKDNVLLDMSDINPKFKCEVTIQKDDNLKYLLGVLTLILEKTSLLPNNLEEAQYVINLNSELTLPLRILKAYRANPQSANLLTISENLLLTSIIKALSYIP